MPDQNLCDCAGEVSNPNDKYREALELIGRHLGEDMTPDAIAIVIARFVAILQEQIESGRTPKVEP